jgi:hypothetical protein
MKRPEISLENHEAMYDWYVQHDPQRLVLGATHLLSRALLHPHVTLEPGTRDDIRAENERGSRYAVASAHFKLQDQNHLSAKFKGDRDLQPIVKDIFIPAKVTYYQKALFRDYLDAAGAWPIIRQQDLARLGAAEKLRLFGEATSSFIDGCATRIVERQSNIAIFSGGTRQTEALTKLAEQKKGTSRIAEKVTERGTRIVIMPIGIWYGDQHERQHHFRPEMYLGRLVTPEMCDFTSYRDIAETLQDSMERAQAGAIQARIDRDAKKAA